MAILAWVSGSIGGLCAVWGILTVIGEVSPIVEELTWIFWFVLSIILLLIAICFAVGRTPHEG